MHTQERTRRPHTVPARSIGQRPGAIASGRTCTGGISLLLTAVVCACGSGKSMGQSAQALSQTGTITDFTSLCVDVQGSDSTSGTPIQLSSCNGAGSQQWTYQAKSFTGLAGKCLDVQWSNTANGTPVQLWDCNGTNAQRWSLKGGQLVGIGGKCLDVNASNSVPGQTLQIWDCNGGQNQQFAFGAAGTAPGGSGDGGTLPAIRVAAGATSPYTDPTGLVWSADTGFTGGIAAESVNQPVQGTNAPTLYDGQRYGDQSGFRYNFQVAPGTYNVTLKFTENWVTGPAQRLFGVSINGQSVLDNFDIYAESGGLWIALDKTFPVSLASPGSIEIDFNPGSVQDPKVDAIDIESVGAPGGGADAGGGGADPCQGQTCSGNGTCVASGSTATCNCDSGFQASGLSCVASSGGGAGSVGPAATSPFITADFTNMTSPAGVANVVVAPQLFGAATGGLGNNGFGALSNPTSLGLVRALNLPLFRLNANFASPQSSGAIAPLVAHALDLFPSTCTWVIGVDDAASASDVASYVKSNSAIDCKLWEVHNESQPGESSSSYDSDALSIASAVKAVDPSYRVAGDISAGLDIGDLVSLVQATDSSTLGILDFHDYLYCNGGGAQPSDEEVCQAWGAGQTMAFTAQDQQAIQSSMQGTFAASVPVLLGEYNDECSASFADLRAGTSIGAAFMASATLGMAAVSTQPVWTAVWDLFDDGGANYNLMDASNNLYPQYYTLQRLIANMPGNMVNSTEGSSASRGCNRGPPRAEATSVWSSSQFEFGFGSRDKLRYESLASQRVGYGNGHSLDVSPGGRHQQPGRQHARRRIDRERKRGHDRRAITSSRPFGRHPVHVGKNSSAKKRDLAGPAILPSAGDPPHGSWT